MVRLLGKYSFSSLPPIFSTAVDSQTCESNTEPQEKKKKKPSERERAKEGETTKGGREGWMDEDGELSVGGSVNTKTTWRGPLQ